MIDFCTKENLESLVDHKLHKIFFTSILYLYPLKMSISL